MMQPCQNAAGSTYVCDLTLANGGRCLDHGVRVCGVQDTVVRVRGAVPSYFEKGLSVVGNSGVGTVPL